MHSTHKPRTWVPKEIYLREPEQAVQTVRCARIAVENIFGGQEQRQVASSAGQQAAVLRGLWHV